MKTSLNRRRLPLALAFLVAGVSAALCDDVARRGDEDFDEARRAVEEGKVKPLAEILADVSERLDGEVVGVEFEREDGRYIYEFKVITAGGNLREVFVDATSAEILDRGAD